MPRTFVASHIQTQQPQTPYFSPIQTGSAGKESWPGFIRDDTGDSISHLNRNFGELTGLYWLWKNTTDEKVGWCHYRRFFSPTLFSPDHFKGVAVDVPLAQIILDQNQTGSIFDFELNLCDMILPVMIPVQFQGAAWYCGVYREEDWKGLLEAVAEVYPDEYEGFVKYFNEVHPLHFWCMFMAKRETLNAYCEWLFPLLFRMSEKITPSEDNFQCRVYAFVTELIFNWWTASRGIKAVHRPIIFLPQAKPEGVF
ncbi:DUF4422 domain-containing protein [Caulobacter sp. 73W]|uniref:DUF4422 domain-containing protein n=1 Tax=Caulobacter sp. 73W TaxID=3161137 RepID=A0AB39KWX2_9CAUL